MLPWGPLFWGATRDVALASMIYSNFHRRECRSTAFRAVAALSLAFAQAGCSMSFPLASFLGEDATGSVKPTANALAKQLDGEDWKIAEPVLAKALRAEASQGPEAWANPDSGKSGAFVGVAASFTRQGKTCRAFVARIDAPIVPGAEPAAPLQGTGCLGEGAQVLVSDLAPFKGL